MWSRGWVTSRSVRKNILFLKPFKWSYIGFFPKQITKNLHNSSTSNHPHFLIINNQHCAKCNLFDKAGRTEGIRVEKIVVVISSFILVCEESEVIQIWILYSIILSFILCHRQAQIISPRIIREASSFDKFKIIRECMAMSV